MKINGYSKVVIKETKDLQDELLQPNEADILLYNVRLTKIKSMMNYSDSAEKL